MRPVPPPTPIIVMSADELAALVRRSVVEALAEHDTSTEEVLSANQAARLARVRTDVLLAALASGELKGGRRGRYWKVARVDVLAWSALRSHPPTPPTYTGRNSMR